MERRVPALRIAARTLTLIMLLLCARAFSLDQPELSGAPLVLVATRASGGEGSGRYDQVIERLARITLGEGGLRCTAAAPAPGESGSPDGDPAQACLQAAREAAADYLLYSSYAAGPEGLAVEFSLYATDAGALVGRVSRQGKIDLNLDRAIESALTELLVEAAGELAQFRETSGALAAPLTPDAESHGGPVLGAPMVGVPGPPVVRPEPARGRFRRLEISAGGAPFLPVGAASDYFKVGLSSTLGGAFRFELGSLVLGLGLEVGSSLFEAVGLSSSAGTILAPIGALVTCTLSYGTPLEVAARLSGGAALLSMAPSGVEERLNKLLPYATGGICLGLAFGPALGVLVDTRFVAYFEQAQGGLSPLFGVTPTVCLYLRV